MKKYRYKNIFTLAIFLLIAATSTFAQPMVGNYTINSNQATGGTNFQTFFEFSTALSTNGISGNVVADVVMGSGPYDEQVVFNTVPGAADTASVTINGNGETITAFTTTTDRYVIRLTDVQYFGITNLRVVRDTTSSGGFYGIHIFNTGRNISITNCHVDMSGTTSTLYGAYVASGSETSILTTGDFHDLTFFNDTATGGGYGVSVFGLVSDLASNIVISNNTFYDFHSNGVYLRETDGAIINDNYFDKRTSNITSVNAIQIAQAANINSLIFGNFIKVSQVDNGSMPFRGIYLFNGTGHRVFNNVIHDVNLTSGNFTAIEVRTAGTAPEIYFNTISLDNPNTSSGELFGIAEELSNTNSIIRNNIISISQPTIAVKAGLVLGGSSTPTTALNSDYNDIWVPGGNVAMKATIATIPYPTLTDWQTASGQDMNSQNVDPGFVSQFIMIPTNSLLDNTGVVIPTVLTDITGALRNSPPDMGAFEFLGTGVSQLSKNNQLMVYPSPVNSKLNVKLNSGGQASVVSVYSMKGELVLSRTVPGIEDEVSFDVSDLANGVYTIKTFQSDRIATGRFIKN
ncbi:MAG: T9SS type A sorting domain-containing protein [Bacteroidetes bacterium]|nr:T9SS type A sorting domain-containing protein [Bacteroidota bacterium]